MRIYQALVRFLDHETREKRGIIVCVVVLVVGFQNGNSITKRCTSVVNGASFEQLAGDVQMGSCHLLLYYLYWKKCSCNDWWLLQTERGWQDGGAFC